MFSPGEVVMVVGGLGHIGYWAPVGDEVTIVADIGLGFNAIGDSAQMYEVTSPRITALLARQSEYHAVALVEHWLRRRPPPKQDWSVLCNLKSRETESA